VMHRMNRCDMIDKKRTISVYDLLRDGGTQSGAVETRWFFVWNVLHTGRTFQENDSVKRLTSDLYITICAIIKSHSIIMKVFALTSITCDMTTGYKLEIFDS
ncbi:MAG: hypothetical protein KOO63_14540, partial [Bacteroidales bacterium]|nr:hypothetical protein [Candidatus Latescibacterota bacterium]